MKFKIRLGLPKGQIRDLVLPWLFRQLGAGKWLRERGLHVPAAALPELAKAAATIADQLNAADGNQVASPKPEHWWRAVEIVTAQAVNGEIEAAITTAVTRVV